MTTIDRDVRRHIRPYDQSRLASLVHSYGPYAIKFVPSRWAEHYATAAPLKISATPALTWGTATYITPIAYPLSSVLYGRIGLVSEFDPSGWRVFDATSPSAQSAYMNWAQRQPIFSDLLLTVHSTHVNHFLRDAFRTRYGIDCVLFHPDQEAELHTQAHGDVWMAVTDWAKPGIIDSGMSSRFGAARFTVLIDEEFSLTSAGLPIRTAPPLIEPATARFAPGVSLRGQGVKAARSDPSLPGTVAATYAKGGYIHLYIEP